MSDPIVMVQAFAELRYGVVVHMRENAFTPPPPPPTLYPPACRV